MSYTDEAIWKRVKKERADREKRAAALPDWCKYQIGDEYRKTALIHMPAAMIANDFNDWIMLMGTDNFAPEYRNDIMNEWRARFIEPVAALGPSPGNLFSDERKAMEKLHDRKDLDLDHMSIRQMLAEAYSQEYSDAYARYMSNQPFTWLFEQWKIMREGAGLPVEEEAEDGEE